MNSPDSNSITIRLEINVPGGANVSPVGPEPRAPAPRPPGDTILFPPLWIGAGNPAQTVIYNQNSTIAARTRTGSNLGSFCISFRYQSPAPTQVMALVYPEVLWRPEADPPTPAVMGRPNADNTLWTWDGVPDSLGRGGELHAADYTASGPGAPNKISVWFWNGVWNFDTPLRVLGTMGTSGPCGSGSGSGTGAGPPGRAPRVTWFGTSISQTLMATVVAASAGADLLVGLSVPLTYYAVLSGSPAGGWFGRAQLLRVLGVALYVEVSMIGSGDQMTVGARVVVDPGAPRVITPAAPPVPFTAGPFSLTSFLATGESGSPLSALSLALAITE